MHARPYLLLLCLTAFLPLTAQTWSPAEGTPFSGRYDDVQFLTDSIAYACNGQGAVYKSIDGGFSFAPLTPVGGYNRTVEFIDEQTGFLGNLSGSFYRTNDGGQTWADIADQFNAGAATSICALDHVGRTVFGAGVFSDPAYFVKSTDGGQTWTYTRLDSLADGLTEVHFFNEKEGLLSGIDDELGGVILRTTDGGESWSRVHLTQTGFSYVWKLDFPSDSVGYGAVERFAAGEEYVVKTTDGGRTWKNLVVNDTYLDLQGIGFLTEDYGYVGPRDARAFVTRDGGQSWEPDPSAPFNLNKIVRKGNRLLAAGSRVHNFTDSLVVSAFEVGSLPAAGHRLTVSPNPSDGPVSVDVRFATATQYRLDVITAGGRFVQSVSRGLASPGERRFSMDLTSTPAGAYLVVLHTNREAMTERLVIR